MTIESDGMDCGIDGDDNSPITHKEHNRFVRRVLTGHVLPMHRKLTVLENWNKDADKVIDKITGGIMAIKFLGVLVLISVGATFGATVWMMRELAVLLTK